jgi:hypothetical protein
MKKDDVYFSKILPRKKIAGGTAAGLGDCNAFGCRRVF